jgi:hypothetical protein
LPTFRKFLNINPKDIEIGITGPNPFAVLETQKLGF